MSTPVRKPERHKSAFDNIASRESLQEAWKYLFRNSRSSSRNTKGIDGLSINDFALDPKANLRRLRRDLVNGPFEFQPLRPFLIPKPSGKDRLICVPTVGDRIVQRALLDFLSSKYRSTLENQISYGFIRDRGVKKAALLAQTLRSAHSWVFKTDIASFFDEVDRSILEKEIRGTIRQPSLHPILLKAASCEISMPTGNAARRIAVLGIRKGRGIRQGMPLSPLFANIFLDKFDRKVIAAGYLAIRYADDIVFFAEDKDKCSEIHTFCREHLRSLNLTIPDIGPNSKSQIYGPAEAAEFLGLGLCKSNGGYVLRLMPKQIEKIKAEFMQLGAIPELLARKVTLAKLGGYVHSRVNGYLHAYDACSNMQELENVFTDMTQKILRRIYVEGLKINISGLTKEGRAFLGLA